MLYVRFTGTANPGIVILQLFENHIGTVHDAARHTGNLCHMDTERVLTASRFQFTQEDYLSVHLSHTHIEVLDARKVLLHLVELMIVGSKERTCLRLLMFVQIFHDSPGNGNTIVGRSTSSQLIKEHQRARRNVVQDVCCLGHLYHEGRFAERYIVACTYTCKDFIHQSNSGALCGHKTAYLCQQHDKGGLAQQSRFTSHVRTGNHHDLLFLGIEQHIVRYIAFAQRQLGFNHRMPALLDVEHLRIIDDRAHVAVLVRCLCK